jgi:hypothetical protein
LYGSREWLTPDEGWAGVGFERGGEPSTTHSRFGRVTSANVRGGGGDKVCNGRWVHGHLVCKYLPILEGGVYEGRQVDARGMGLVNKYMSEDGKHIFGPRDGMGHAAEFP